MATRDEIVRYLDERLGIAAMEDASANGLQVQGTEEVKKVGLAVDGALEVYERAVEAGCELLLVHHGIIWGGGIRAVTGRDHDHLSFLLSRGLNLYAAHLPLDAHAELGNNAELARMVGLEGAEPFGAYHGTDLGFAGELPGPRDLAELAGVWRAELGGEPLTLPFGPERISSVGIVSGGGSSALPEAIARGLDCFVTGEGRHEDHHLALEGKINVLYLGHYHSETVGVKAVGAELAERFGVATEFLDVPTVL